MSKSDKSSKSEPMDSTIREQSTGTPSANNRRVCYAIKTLVAEFHELFPETEVEYSDYDGYNVGLAVSFDCSMIEEDDQITLVGLFNALLIDPRIESVDFAEDQILVSIKRSRRTQDSRDSFGVAEAWEVLTEGEDDDSDDLLGWVDEAADFPASATDMDMFGDTHAIRGGLTFGGSL